MRHKVARAIQLARGCTCQVACNQLSDNLSVALIVADLQMDCETVCAAVLRGLVGMAHCSEQRVQDMVGKGVIRILNFHHQLERCVNLCMDDSFTDLSYSNLRELILVGAMDEHRAISLELARAVLAIRTIEACEDAKGRELLAKRTLYLYAPLANQLGIWFVQGELEELAFMYLQPRTFFGIRRLVAVRMRECESTLVESKHVLERILSTATSVKSVVRAVLIKGRVKGVYSVYRKMKRSGKKVCEIYDLLALRVVVQPKLADEDSEIEACYAVANVIRNHFETIEHRAKDYIVKPKRNSYRSLHMTVLEQGGCRPLEIQVRTDKMHHVAEFGAAAHWMYKERWREDVQNESASTPSSVMAHGREGVKRDMSPSVSGATTSALRSGSSRPAVTSSRIRVSRRPGRDDVQEQLRKGYVTCLASAIRASRVIVAAAGQMYGLAAGSTLLDLAHGLGLASIGAIAVVNGSVAPLTQQLRMNDMVRFILTLPEA